MAGTKRDAGEFVNRWRGRGDENQDTQLFWIELLQNVLGLEDALERVKFEVPVSTAASEHKGYIDVLIPSAKAIVEQKSLGIDLAKPEVRQGRKVTPAQQANGYIEGMALSQQPRYVIACNFAEFWVFDRERDSLFREPLLKIELEDLPKNLAALQFLKGDDEAPASVARAVSVEAGRIMGKIHAEISKLYHNPNSEESHHALSVLCTRIMFLMFCEDAGLIELGLFQRYIAASDARHLRVALIELFRWLDTDDEARKKEYPDELLTRFPYMDGGLFGEDIEIPQLTDAVRYEILVSGCQEFDWSGVDPTVFGSIFEGALSHDTRRSGGMHYTSPENIHKVIDPLFLDGLRAELDAILAEATPAVRTRRLNAFHDKIADLTFLDPACGSGNFLTETYVCLRRLENRVILAQQQQEAARKRTVAAGQTGLDFEEEGTGDSPVRVSLENFHGIEINDFACCVARTALWIAEKQADAATAKIVQRVYDPLPLKNYDTIRQGNALRMDWNDVVPAERLCYIMGNPPFIGYSNLTADQKEDRETVLGKGSGFLDYVVCWYRKAADYMGDLPIQAALVSTNSICQGQQVDLLWKPLFDGGIHINFAHRTFVWNSEATDEARVHVIIVGFSRQQVYPKLLFDGVSRLEVPHINAYLSNAPDTFISKRKKPLSSVSEMSAEFKPAEHGNLLLDAQEYGRLMAVDPSAASWIRPFSMGAEFINGIPRYCLWLEGISASDLKAHPFIRKRVEACRAWRSEQVRTGDAYRYHDRPHLFKVCNYFVDGPYIAVPQVSSGRRKYVPMGFVTNGMIPGNMLFFIPEGTVYEFGVLMSQMHNAWMRAVAGRLKSDYRYTNTIVYNNFIWPEPTDAQRAAIEKCAQAVLNARARYEGSTLADMYDPDSDFLYPDLMRAHRDLDAAVEAAYGVDFGGDEEKIVAHLFKLYAEKVDGR